MRVVDHPEHNKADMLATLDDLRSRVVNGDVMAFVAVGITVDDETMTWIGKTGHVTRLRTIGATAYMLHHLCAGSA